jgi:hypothetical protein
MHANPDFWAHNCPSAMRPECTSSPPKCGDDARALLVDGSSNLDGRGDRPGWEQERLKSPGAVVVVLAATIRCHPPPKLALWCSDRTTRRQDSASGK